MLASDPSGTDAELMRRDTARYERGQKLSGAIYMHRITDNRMGGFARRNFITFRKLCGERNLKSVVIATSMWTRDKDSDEYKAEERREAQLKSSELFFKHALENDARMIRYEGGEASALNVVRMLLKRGPPEVLRMQNELVKEKKPLAETDAGAEVHAYLEEEAEKHKRDIEKTKAQYAQEVAEARERKTGRVEGYLEAIETVVRLRKELNEIVLDMQQRVSNLEEQVRRLQEDNANLRLELVQRMEQMVKDIAEGRVRLGSRKQEGAEKTATMRPPSDFTNKKVERTVRSTVVHEMDRPSTEPWRPAEHRRQDGLQEETQPDVGGGWCLLQ